MLFTDGSFLFLFLPIVVIVLRLRRVKANSRWAAFCILVASLLFYATWDIRSIPFLLVSILANYGAVTLLQRQDTPGKYVSRKLLLTIGVCFNLGSLAFSKYWVSLVIPIFGSILPSALQFHSPWFPVGISFFSFTQVAYLIESYRGAAIRASLLTFASYVLFFPHLVCGPILRQAETIPELEAGSCATNQQLIEGLQLLIRGMIRKTLIADPLGVYIQPLIASIESGSSFGVRGSWVVIICYAFQIYFDFSGYSMMAVGIARMLGYRIPINFDAPYRSLGIIDFWRRWHISLSIFLRDYLYIPLGGGRRGRGIQYRNLLITMTLGGLWHGSTFNFALWGMIHGCLLVGEHMIRARRPRIIDLIGGRFLRLFGQMLTFALVVLAWVPFRFEHIGTVWRFWGNLFGLGGEFGTPWPNSIILPLLLGLVFVIMERRTQTIENSVASLKQSKLSLMIHGLGFVVALLASGTTTEFLYARF